MSPLPLPASLSLALLGTVCCGGHHTVTEVGRAVKLSTNWLQETWRPAASSTPLQWD